MAIPIKDVAASAMDAYYKDFATDNDFFKLDDFITRCAYTLANIYQQQYLMLYAEQRADRNDGLVTFDPLWLNVQDLTVKRKDGDGFFAEYTKPVMAFAYGNSSPGVQQAIAISPNEGMVLERATLAELQQFKYVPYVNRVFFIPMKTGLKIIQKGNCTVSKLNLYYVPEAGEDMDVPDVLAAQVVDETVDRMLGRPVIVKKTADGNPNMVMETEMNKNALK